MSKKSGSEILKKYLPDAAIESCIDWMNEYRLQLTIKKSRATKLGDFRPALRGKPAKISVNGDLNKYAFLITLVHEIAHGICWDKYQQKVLPHGKEWKQIYSNYLSQFIGKDIFPEDLEPVIILHINSPKAASCSDVTLLKALKSYDENPVIHLDDLEEDSIFQLSTGRVFQKKELKRKRYICIELSTKKRYLINGIAEVLPLENIAES